MKKVFLPLATVALLASTTSCSKDEEFEVKFDSKLEIRPEATILSSMTTRAEEEDENSGTRAVAFNGTYAVTAFEKSDGEETNGTHFINKTCDAYGFAEKQYYPADNTELNFYAYAPTAGATYTAATHKINWTITGQEDLVWSSSKGHSKTTGGQPHFTFAHKLASLTINVVKDATFSDQIEIKSITIPGVQTDATLDLRTGDITYGSTTGTISLPEAVGKKIGSVGSKLGTLMLPAGVQSYILNVVTKNADGTDMNYGNIPLRVDRGGDYIEGNDYEVTLTFKGTEIENSSAKIAEWNSGGSVSSDVK